MNHKILYRIKYLVFINIIFSILIFGQDRVPSFSGKIVDGQNFEPLPFANISYQNLNVGTTTDENGKFTLSYLPKEEKIIISYVGYKSLIIPINDIDQQKENLFSLSPIEIFLQEVTVYSNQNKKIDLEESQNLSMQSERIREISPAMPDILRSVQALPGIAVDNEFKANFNVRGGNQDENLVLVNGAQVYEPYHIKEAANASVGIFNVDLVKKVDLISGGFSARYGDKMSSVLNIQYREGNKEKYKGAALLSLAYADAYIEGPITTKSSFILGVRKSYTEYVLSLIDYEDVKTAKPSFYDVQGVLSFNLSTSNKILFEFIHSGDDFSYKPGKNILYNPTTGTHNGESADFRSTKVEKENDNASYYSNLFDLQSINIISNKALLNFELSYYGQTDDEYRLFNRITADNITATQSDNFYFDSLYTTRLTYDSLKIETMEFKSNLQYQFSTFYEINTGFGFQKILYRQINNDTYTYKRSENLKNVDIVNKDTLVRAGSYGSDIPVDAQSYKFNLYLENIIQPNENLTFNIGGRLDYFDINKELTFSPRVSAAYSLGNNTILRGAWGHYYQSPDYKQFAYSESSDSNTKSQEAIHYILGIEKTFYLSNTLNNFFKLKLEGYYKDYLNVISSYYGTFERLTYSKKNDAIGNAKGLDIYAILSLPGFYSWISYGLLFANEDILNDNLGEYPRYTDQRHTLALVSNLDLGENWNITLSGFYGSGFPYTPKTAVKDNSGVWMWKSGKIHSATLPAYKRVDFRIAKTFDFEKSDLNVFIDVSNIFNFKNIQYYDYEPPSYKKTDATEVLLWPIIPSFGIRWEFK